MLLLLSVSSVPGGSGGVGEWGGGRGGGGGGGAGASLGGMGGLRERDGGDEDGCRWWGLPREDCGDWEAELSSCAAISGGNCGPDGEKQIFECNSACIYNKIGPLPHNFSHETCIFRRVQ